MRRVRPIAFLRWKRRLDRIALLLADSPTPMESTSEEAGCVVGLEACATAHLLGA